MRRSTAEHFSPRPASMAVSLLCIGIASLVGAQVHAGELDGIWRSRGYALVLDVRGDEISQYDVTSISCLKRPEATKTAQVLLRPRLLGARELVAGSATELTDFYYQRLDALPASCSAPARDAHDPVWNFDVFWQYFQDYYAFFDARGLDWRAIRAAYRPRVRADMQESELFDLLQQILRQFQDSHVDLRAGDRLADGGISVLYREWYQEYLALPQPRGNSDSFLLHKAREYLAAAWQRYLDPGSARDLHENFVLGSMGGGKIAYMMVGAEGSYTEGGDPATQFAASKSMVARAFAAAKGKQALVLDLRFNTGGDDRIAIDMAGRIAAGETPGLGKCARDGEGYTPLQQTRIERQPEAFDGAVIVLTSLQTISAGENFVMMVKDYPQVLLVGETTASVHSDVLHRPLPNGWEVGLSNEVFVAPEGQVFETVGVDPHLRIPFFAERVRTTGIDPALEKALHLLSEAGVGSAQQLRRFKTMRPVGKRSPCAAATLLSSLSR
jgi:carboxyl-terminal processing protease